MSVLYPIQKKSEVIFPNEKAESSYKANVVYLDTWDLLNSIQKDTVFKNTWFLRNAVIYL